MKIKPRHQILNDIIKEAKTQPTGWKAAFGRDERLFSQDCYIFHPDTGIYLLKEYQKNPYHTRGIGTKIARQIDDEIIQKTNDKSGEFGIIQGNIQKIIHNIDRGMKPEQIFQAGLQGKDLGIRIPVKGRAETSRDTYHNLQTLYTKERKTLNKKFEKIASEDGLYTSYD